MGAFAPAAGGPISVRPRRPGFRQEPPLKVLVELGPDAEGEERLAEAIRKRIRDTLLVTTEIIFVPHGSLPRSDYKSSLVDWSEMVEGAGI